MMLADHGADVLAIENRRFQADDLFFEDLYRNKNHMTLNLKSDKGLEIFYKLVVNADVVLEGFRPGVVARLGVGYDDVSKVNPRIIYCSISGYGQTGTASNVVGHDVNYLSRAGILDCIGEKERPPVIPAVQVADIAGGGMQAMIGILLALYEREQSGKGQYIDISMTDGLLGLLTLPTVLAKKTGQPQLRSASMLSHRYACYNTYETADGRYVALGAVENRFWANLCEILEIEEYSRLQYDDDRREEIITELRRIFRRKPLAHWEEQLGEADVCFSKVQNMEEVCADPIFHEREIILNNEKSQGAGNMFGVPIKLSRTPGSYKSPPQHFGGSTRKVLTKLGYSEEEIEELYRKGAV
ncbi:MAG: CaiB/BaiF CoA-transferase family protein [Desulfocapsaceae bacterium]|nr:CaiB/BaiF CoA-transferase family protein [Desulfocapsaceae bacterium]